MLRRHTDPVDRHCLFLEGCTRMLCGVKSILVIKYHQPGSKEETNECKGNKGCRIMSYVIKVKNNSSHFNFKFPFTLTLTQLNDIPNICILIKSEIQSKHVNRSVQS